MRTRYVNKIIVISTIILGLILSSFGSITLNAMTSDVERNTELTPQGDIVFSNSTEPIIDGDLESYVGEWENASVETVYIDDIATTVRVQANATHLFIGIQYTSTVFVDYNTGNHTWLGVIFDNNFDDEIGTSNETADDCVVINYKQAGSQDAYINGTTIYSLVADNNVTGVENSIGALGEHLDDFNRHVVSIEIAKELNSMDAAGNDIELYEGETTRYMLMLFQNHTAVYNYTLLDNRISSWNSIRLHPTYEYFTYEEDLSKKSILTYIANTDQTDERNLSVIDVLIDSYGFNNTIKYESNGYDFEYNGIKSYDLVILVGQIEDLTNDDVEALRFYTASGGNLFIMGESSDYESKINSLLANFGLQFYNSTVFSEDLGINSTIFLDSNDIIDIPYLTDSTILTNEGVSSIFYQGSGLNFIMEETVGEMYLQFQEGDLYATLNTTGEFYVDLDDDFEYNSNEDLNLNDSVVFQAALELQRGGKLIATASADIFNSSNILKEDNKHLLIRQLQWLLDFQHLLAFEDFVVEESEIAVGGTLHVEITVFGDNDSTIDNIHVWVTVLELKADQNQEDLITTGDNRHFNGTIIPTSIIKANSIDVDIRMHKRGYGYNQTQLVEVFLNPTVGRPIQLDVIAMIIFFVSIGLVVLGSFATMRYRGKQEEA